MTDKLLIKRELLERLADEIDMTIANSQLAHNLRKVLAAPRQPEGEALPEWVTIEIQRNTIDYLNRDVAELREECERLREDHDKSWRLAGINLENLSAALADNDTLRQQLAERDAEIDSLKERLSNRAAEHCDDLADKIELEVQRDKLAGLLREVRGYYKAMPAGMGGRIDAALAEVKPCPESPAPTT